MTLQAKIITDNNVTLLMDGKTYQISRGHLNWSPIIRALKEKRYDDLPDLVNVQNAMASAAPGFTIVNGAVLFKGTPVPPEMNKLLVKLLSDGFDVSPYVAFVSSLEKNPSYHSREQLFRFVEANKITLTDDGALVLYKNVRRKNDGHLCDIHTGTINNDIGRTVTMERAKVNDNPNETCSAGLHVCSLGYLSSFGGDVTLLVKVFPEDVVSIPVDYNNSKMRVCRYTVIGEHAGGYYKEATTSSVYGRDASTEGEDYWTADPTADYFAAGDVSSTSDDDDDMAF